MVVVGVVGLLITVAAGLPVIAVHIPVPTAAIVAVPLTQVKTSGPALGREETMTATVSVQSGDDHAK